MINDNSWVIHGNYMLKKKENTPLSWSGGGYSRDGSHQKDGASVEEGSRIEFSIGVLQGRHSGHVRHRHRLRAQDVPLLHQQPRGAPAAESA